MHIQQEHIRSLAGFLTGAALGAIACAVTPETFDLMALGAVAGGAGALAFGTAISTVRDLWSFRG